MCHAIIHATFRGETVPQEIRVETPEDLIAREDKLRASDECMGYRVFVTRGRHDRKTIWEESN